MEEQELLESLAGKTILRVEDYGIEAFRLMLTDGRTIEFSMTGNDGGYLQVREVEIEDEVNASR